MNTYRDHHSPKYPKLIRALDKWEYLVIIFLISHRNHVVTPHLNRLIKTIQMEVITGSNEAVTTYVFMQNIQKLSLIISKILSFI